MNDSRFQSVVLLHDHRDSSGEQTAELARMLTEGHRHPNVKFLHPTIPTALEAKANVNLLALKMLPIFQPNSLIVGIGLGGLFAVAMQERYIALNLSVLTINSPLSKDDLQESWRTAKTYGLGRIALYSSQYEPLRGTNPEAWSEYADHAFDVPWLSGGVQGVFYATAYLISSYMRGLDMQKEVSRSLP